ncbi:hypothetical protein TNCV_3581151 [Trichonephila clavipes]|nr:hypothetical protein TNCV_3581151 [Trichonephila clavipes]
MATPGSSFTPTPLGHEDNIGVRYHSRVNSSQHVMASAVLGTFSRQRRLILMRIYVIASKQGVAEFDRKIQRGDSRQHGDDKSSENMGFQTTFSRCKS